MYIYLFGYYTYYIKFSVDRPIDQNKKKQKYSDVFTPSFTTSLSHTAHACVRTEQLFMQIVFYCSAMIHAHVLEYQLLQRLLCWHGQQEVSQALHGLLPDGESWISASLHQHIQVLPKTIGLLSIKSKQTPPQRNHNIYLPQSYFQPLLPQLSVGKFKMGKFFFLMFSH